MINRGLSGTSVTAVLIGTETANRRWVRYEIKRSYNVGNGLLGVYIQNIKDQMEDTDTKGNNPFDYIYIEDNGRKTYFSELYPTYDWVSNSGYLNFGSWIEKAAQAAVR